YWCFPGSFPWLSSSCGDVRRTAGKLQGSLKFKSFRANSVGGRQSGGQKQKGLPRHRGRPPFERVRCRRRGSQAVRSNRSAFITLVQAATKSLTNFSPLSSWA